MDPKERSAEIWATLVAFAEGICKSKERLINRLMGRSKDYLGAIRRRRKAATLEDVVRLATATGMPEWMVFGRLFPQPAAAAELLRHLRQSPRRPEPGTPPPLLARLEKAWSIVGRKSMVAAKGRSPARRRLGWIAEARLADPAEGLRHLENEIVTQLFLLESAKAPESTTIADLAVAVALWADHHRLAGQHETALAACPLALDLAERSEDRWANAHCLWLASLQVHELGHAEYGLAWLDRAAGLFALDGEVAPLPRLLAAQGELLVSLGRYRAAVSALRDALARLPAGENRWRHPVLLALAEAAQAVGRLQEASACLEELAKGHQEQDAFQSEIQWRKAAIELATGDAAQAIATFSQAVGLTTRLGQPLEAGFRLCDFAEQLLRSGQFEKVSGLASELLIRWGGKSADRKLAAAMEDFFAMTRLRPIGQEDIERTRNQLKELGSAPKKMFPSLG